MLTVCCAETVRFLLARWVSRRQVGENWADFVRVSGHRITADLPPAVSDPACSFATRGMWMKNAPFSRPPAARDASRQRSAR